MSNIDTRKSDKAALQLLHQLKENNGVERMLALKNRKDGFDTIERDGNVLYHMSFREGFFIRAFLRHLGEDDDKWKEKLGLALMYYEHKNKMGSGSE
jgi:hypothetical protein